MDSKQLLAGAARVDITPPLGTFINGDFVAHYAQYIHDLLHARALVFQQGDLLIAIVVVDICVMPKNFLDEVKAEVEKQTGILPQNILISATHTHAAGSVASVYLGAADLQYRNKLPALIVRSVVLAKQKIRPAKVAWGSVDMPQYVLSRRYKMKDGYVAYNPVTGAADGLRTNPFGAEHLIDHSQGATDPQVSFMAVKGLDDKWISVLANYSLHYVGDWDNGTISADYFGVFANAVQANLNAGDDLVAMMSNGTSGNINIWDFQYPEKFPTEKFKKSELIGGDIAREVCGKLQNAVWSHSPDLQAQYAELNLKLRKPTEQELLQAERIVAATSYETLQDINSGSLSSLYAREQVLLNDLPDELQFPIQAIKIGDGVIGSVGAEMFAETGLWLKEHAPVKNYFTIGLANGNAGYIPPQHEFANGGYETWRGRTSMLQLDAEGKIRNELLKLISAVSKG